MPCIWYSWCSLELLSKGQLVSTLRTDLVVAFSYTKLRHRHTLVLLISLGFIYCWCITNASLQYHTPELKLSFALRIAYTNNYCSHSFHSLSTSLFPSVSDFLSVRRVKQHDWAGQFPVNARLPLPHTHTHTQGVAPKKPSADFTDPLQGATKSCALPDTFLHNDLTWPKMTRGCQGSYWAGGERDRWRDNEKD